MKRGSKQWYEHMSKQIASNMAQIQIIQLEMSIDSLPFMFERFNMSIRNSFSWYTRQNNT